MRAWAETPSQDALRSPEARPCSVWRAMERRLARERTREATLVSVRAQVAARGRARRSQRRPVGCDTEKPDSPQRAHDPRMLRELVVPGELVAGADGAERGEEVGRGDLDWLYAAGECKPVCETQGKARTSEKAALYKLKPLRSSKAQNEAASPSASNGRAGRELALFVERGAISW